jgi:hypothetical protein
MWLHNNSYYRAPKKLTRKKTNLNNDNYSLQQSMKSNAKSASIASTKYAKGTKFRESNFWAALVANFYAVQNVTKK